MEKRVVEVREGGGGFGIVGVIIGALLVIGVIVFFTGGFDRFAGKSNGGPSVTVNTGAPAAPSAPAPSTTGSPAR